MPVRVLGFLILGLLGFVPAHAAPARTLIFFGDSLTAGYGLDDPATEAYPALIARKIAAAGLDWRVVNAGLSGETTAGGRRRVDWILRQPVDLFFLALGGNDGLRGIEPAVSRANLQAIIDRVRAKYPAANMGADYMRAFAAMYPSLADANHLTLVPFLLEGVGGHPDLNQPDGIHPTPEGHVVVANTVWAALEPLLKANPPSVARP
jgi:acyl-CoA thioesterase-1